MKMADPIMRSHEILSADTEELWEQNVEGSQSFCRELKNRLSSIPKVKITNET